MRVITGFARGRKLKTLEGLEVRPTTEKVKEAVFSALHFKIPGSVFLDLFSGSGQMGIEALSRGASLAVFVDQSKKAQEVIKDNLKAAGLSRQSRVVAADALSFLNGAKDKFDIVFLDPPYNKGILTEILPVLADKMNDGGTIVCEYEKGEEIPEAAGEFCRIKDRKYGKTMVSVYEKRSDEE